MALAILLIDRGWFVPADELLDAPKVIGRNFIAGCFRLNPDAAPNGVTAIMQQLPMSGFALPGYIFVRDDVTRTQLRHVVPHESRHVLDQILLGPFFVLLSGLHSLWLLLCGHPPYHGNIFERRARRHAGQD